MVRGFVSGLVVAVLLGVGSCSGVVAEGEASNRSVVSAGQVPWESAYLDRVKVESMTDRAGCQWMRLKDSTRPTNGVYDEGHCEGMGAIRLKVPALKGVRFNVALTKTAGGRPFQVVYLDPLGGVIHGKFGFSDSMELDCQKYAWNPASGGCYVGIEYDASLWDRSGKLAIEIAVQRTADANCLNQIRKNSLQSSEEFRIHADVENPAQRSNVGQDISITETNDWFRIFRIFNDYEDYCIARENEWIDERSLTFVDEQRVYVLPLIELSSSVTEFPPFQGDVVVRAPIQVVGWQLRVQGRQPITFGSQQSVYFNDGTRFMQVSRPY